MRNPGCHKQLHWGWFESPTKTVMTWGWRWHWVYPITVHYWYEKFTFELSLSSVHQVDWQIYTHYSGHQSFTKGLLLVDQSAGHFRRALEMTSQEG